MINTPLFQALKREKELTEMYDYLRNRASRRFLEDYLQLVCDEIMQARNREQVFIDNNVKRWLKEEGE